MWTINNVVKLGKVVDPSHWSTTQPCTKCHTRTTRLALSSWFVMPSPHLPETIASKTVNGHVQEKEPSATSAPELSPTHVFHRSILQIIPIIPLSRINKLFNIEECCVCQIAQNNALPTHPPHSAESMIRYLPYKNVACYDFCIYLVQGIRMGLSAPMTDRPYLNVAVRPNERRHV